MYVVITGNPFDGDVRLWGPFENTEKAKEWAERFYSGGWWLFRVDLPTEVNPREG
jgi:hypothetical protein